MGRFGQACTRHTLTSHTVCIHPSFTPWPYSISPIEVGQLDPVVYRRSDEYVVPAPGVLASVRVIVSRSIITYSTPSAPLVGTHRDFTAMRLIRDAFAVRVRLGDPRLVPSFR